MSASPYTLLIVDDCAADRELYRRSLLADSRSMYRPIEAESIAEGLKLCQSQSIDAIVLEYLLPDGDGLEFLAALSVQSGGNPPPVVMLTGQGNETIAVQAMKLGAQDYLVKRNLTPALLQTAIRTAIENAQLKRKLAQCQERFRISIHNMRECVSIFSAIRDDAGQIIDFRFDYLNPAALENNRMTAKDIGSRLCEVFPAFNNSGLFAEYCHLVETGEPLIKEDLVYEDVFGGERLRRIYSVQATKLDDGLVSYWRDETAKRQTQRQLDAANRQITTIWESMTDAYATLDRDWRVVYTNPAAIELYRQTTGLTPAAYLNKTHWEVFPATVGTIVEREYRRAVAEGVAVHFELFYQPTETWFETHAYPSAEGLGIYFRDITDRKLDELARIAAEQERDRFFNLSIDLLIVANLDGYFVRLNSACERVLGFTHAELMAQPYLDFVHPDDRAHTLAAAESLNTGNVLVNFENRYRCKDGSYRWILWSTMPDLERKLLYANGHDITDRKIAELNERFLYELMQRLRQLTDAEAIKWEAIESLGEYLDVDRAAWFEMDLERGLGTIDRDWYREGLNSHAGVYQIADFTLPQLLADLSAGRAVAISDVTANPLTAPHIATYEQLRVSAFVSIPYIEEGRLVATLNVNTTTARIWRDDEIELMQAVVMQLWSLIAQAQGVEALRAQEQQTRAARAIVEQQLREIEAIYQTAPVGLCFVDTNMQYVRVNEQLAQINGLPVAEHIGRTPREVLPEVADQLELLYRQVMESGEPILNLEVSGIVPSQLGVERHWLISYYPQTDVQGHVVGVNMMVQEITDRKREEAKLQQAEATIREQLSEIETIYRTAPVGMGFGDANMQYVRINERLAQINGLPAAAHIGRTPREVLPEISDQLEPLYRQVMESGEPILDLELSGIVPSQPGVERHWLLCYYPLKDAQERVVGVNSIVQEITDRKQMEAALRQSESQLRLFVQHVPAGVAMFDRDMRYIIASDRWIDSYDLPDRDIVGRSHYDIFPDLPQGWIEVHQRCLAGAIESSEEDPFPRADGSLDWVRWEAHPWYTNPDEVGGIIIFSEVITERKIAEKRLQESEQRLKTGVAVAGVGLATFDYATNLVELSPEAAALYGFPPDNATITRDQFHATFHPDERAELEEAIERVLDPQGTGWFAQDYRVVWPSGEVRCLSVRKQVFFGGEASPVENRSGAVHRPTHAILAAIDITERKQNQADLEQRNRELDSFVYVVSHDLKAPLRAVAHLSQWIEDDLEGQLTADTQVQMTQLRDRVQRMSATIDGLLEYARIGRDEDEIAPVALSRLLADVIDSIAPPPTFTIDLPAELPTLSTKRTPLFQVFVNLVGNGIKHHHSEAGSIQISIEQRGDWYEFAIADDGPGIAPEQHDRVFRIFQAVNPQNRTDSTGIGLAIVKKIVEAEGGTIKLESQIGKGTTFYFTWPKR